MRKNLFILVWISLIFVFVAPVFASTPVLLNFREVKPVETATASLAFSLPLDEVERISFEYSDIIDQNSGRIIPADRISFTYQRQTVSPGQALEFAPARLAAGNPSSEQTGNFAINIKFLPSDPPGKYEGTIYALAQTAGGEVQRIPLILKINVLPWIKLRTAVPQQQLVIDEIPFRGETELKSRQPVRILIASNASWELYMKIENMLTGKTEPVPIELHVHPSANYTGFNNRFDQHEGYKLIAAGPPTVAGTGPEHAGYWTELVFSASIPQAHQYPTGQYSFGLSFYGIPLEP